MQVLVFGSRSQRLISAKGTASFVDGSKKNAFRYRAPDYFCTFARINPKLKYKTLYGRLFRNSSQSGMCD